MQIALLIGANPKTCNNTAVVRLDATRWKMITGNVIDSVITLRNYSNGSIIDQNDFTGPCLVYCDFETRGSESFVSAYAVPFDSTD